MGKLVDLTGRRFGMLTVKVRDGTGSDRSPMWICDCDCGAVRRATSRELVHGKVHSCKACTREWRLLNPRDGYRSRANKKPVVSYRPKDLKSLPAERACVYNNGIQCLPCPKPCFHCGWNPQVADGRRAESCLKTRT